MSLRSLLILGFFVGIAGCAEKDEAAPGEPGEMEQAAPAAEAEAAPEPAEAWRTSAFLDHMHAHAEHLDDLNFALDDGDLEMAMTPAYWLSRHEAVAGLPAELQPYLVQMRQAARAVEASKDLESAREAAQQIGKACQACHAEVGVSTE